MNQIELNGVVVHYKLKKKKNKNTYFYFKRAGYIQINLSRFQKESDIIKYMQENAIKFSKKFMGYQNTYDQLRDKYMLLGKIYDIKHDPSVDFFVDDVTNTVYTKHADNHPIYFDYETKLMLNILNELLIKHQGNPHVNLDNITLKTRLTTTRHGSCNTKKRNININLGLIHFDKKYIEYVLLHEITHLIEQNHQQQFYTLFEKLCPNYKILRQELKEIYR